MSEKKYQIQEGINGNWFVRCNEVLIAGFTTEQDAHIFVKAKRHKDYENISLHTKQSNDF